MIYTNATVTVSGEQSTVDKAVILYRGDYEVQIRFYVMQSLFYQNLLLSKSKATNLVSDIDASFAQLVIKVPEGEPIFSDVTPVEKDGAIIFTITANIIDEIEELGSYDFQIRLFDADKTSRATIPPVVGGIKIKEPIATEDGSTVISDTNEVNVAQTNYAITTTATPLDVFDEDGNYIETTWTDKMLITDARLNKIEQGITGVNQKADSVTGASNITIADTANNFTSTNVEGALQEVGSQIKDVAKDLLLEDSKLYLKKSDGTKLGTGVVLPVSGSGGSIKNEWVTLIDKKISVESVNSILENFISEGNYNYFKIYITRTSDSNNTVTSLSLKQIIVNGISCGAFTIGFGNPQTERREIFVSVHKLNNLIDWSYRVSTNSLEYNQSNMAYGLSRAGINSSYLNKLYVAFNDIYTGDINIIVEGGVV